MIRQGITVELRFMSASIWRGPDHPNQVKSITFYTWPGSVRQVKADALDLAEKFKIEGHDQLDLFNELKAQRIIHNTPKLFQSASDAVQPRSVVIEQSFADTDKEWAATVGIGFPDLSKKPP